MRAIVWYTSEHQGDPINHRNALFKVLICVYFRETVTQMEPNKQKKSQHSKTKNEITDFIRLKYQPYLLFYFGSTAT